MSKRKLIKREGQRVVIPPKYKKRIKDNLCPICSKPKKEWIRRKDWRCCSVDCTNKWNKDIYIWSWPEFRLRVFRRDNFTCVNCGFKARTERNIEGYLTGSGNTTYREWLENNYLVFEENDKKLIVGDDSKLIADHIIPISLGGDEWEINNIQTLCIDCNKIKTKKDAKKIAIARRTPVSQEVLKL